MCVQLCPNILTHIWNLKTGLVLLSKHPAQSVTQVDISISPQKYEASDQIGDEKTHKAYPSL